MRDFRTHFKKQVKKLSSQDKDFKKLFQIHGHIDFEPEFKREPFESLVRAIAHQQLHGKAAQTILNRMLALFPDMKFSTPEDLIKITVEDLRSCGFSASKTKAIKDIAQKTIEGVIPTKKIIQKMTNEEIIQRLTQAHGVGEWTVQMLLIFQLGRLDVWPVLDFGVRNGYKIFYKKKEMPTPKQLKKIGERWSPFQSILALYFWAHADIAKKAAPPKPAR